MRPSVEPRILALCLAGSSLLLGNKACDEGSHFDILGPERDAGGGLWVDEADAGSRETPADKSDPPGEHTPAAGSGAAGSGGASGPGVGAGAAAGRAAAGSPPASGAGGAKPAGTGGAASEAGPGGSTSAAPHCGTRGGAQCSADEFCDFDAAQCGETDRGGLCAIRPLQCTDDYKPICGCDGRTYANACEAHAAGVSVKRQGACSADECQSAGGRLESSDDASTPQCQPGEESWSVSGVEQAICCSPLAPRGRTCGGIAALTCDTGQFCDYEPAAGGQGCDGTIADAAGVCARRPTACTRDYLPVCGCDRRTYGNRCLANGDAASVLHEGACTELDCEAIGGRPAYGAGPGPKCNPGEEAFTTIVNSDGSIPIEGALCCVAH